MSTNAADAAGPDSDPGDEQPVDEHPADAQPVDEQPGDGTDGRSPSWWHRDHPTFTALTGFFTGLLFIVFVPALYAGVLSLFLDQGEVQDLFPFVLVTLVVPLVLVVNKRTRRFGTYFWVGILLTAVVVIGVAALVLWWLVSHE